MEQKKISKIAFIIFVIIILIVILHYTKVLRPLESVVAAAFKPVQTKIFDASQFLNDFYQDRKTKGNLQEENEKLQAELIKMQITESRLKELEEQNDFLRKQLEFFNENQIRGVAANVIGKSQDNYQNFIIIDKGEKHGIKEGLAVTDKDVVIGKIDKASKYTSKVLLVNDSFSKLAVSIQNSDNSIGVLSGEYGLGLKIDLIPQTEEIAEGDYVITSGLEQGIPRSLLVGQIDNVLYTEGELFKTAFVRSPIDFNKINFVSVLLNSYDQTDN